MPVDDSGKWVPKLQPQKTGTDAATQQSGVQMPKKYVRVSDRPGATAPIGGPPDVFGQTPGDDTPVAGPPDLAPDMRPPAPPVPDMDLPMFGPVDKAQQMITALQSAFSPDVSQSPVMQRVNAGIPAPDLPMAPEAQLGGSGAELKPYDPSQYSPTLGGSDAELKPYDPSGFQLWPHLKNIAGDLGRSIVAGARQLSSGLAKGTGVDKMFQSAMKIDPEQMQRINKLDDDQNAQYLPDKMQKTLEYTGDTLGMIGQYGLGWEVGGGKFLANVAAHALENAPATIGKFGTSIAGALGTGLSTSAFNEALDAAADPGAKTFPERLANVAKTTGYLGMYGAAGPLTDRLMKSAGEGLAPLVPEALNSLGQQVKNELPNITDFLAKASKGATHAGISAGMVGSGLAGIDALKNPDYSGQDYWNRVGSEIKNNIAFSLVHHLAAGPFADRKFDVIDAGESRPRTSGARNVVDAEVVTPPGLLMDGNRHADIMQDITNEVINRLPDSDKNDLQGWMQERMGQGLTAEQAKAEALDMISQHPEGQTIIGDVVRNTIDSETAKHLAGMPSPVSEAKPSAPTEVRTPELGDVFSMRPDIVANNDRVSNPMADQKYTVIGDLGKNVFRVRGENGTEHTINKAGFGEYHGQQEISAEDKTKMEGQAAFDAARNQLVTNGGSWQNSTKVKHLENMKALAEQHGLDFSPRYQELLDKFTAEREADKTADRKDPNESWVEAANRLSPADLRRELAKLPVEQLHQIRDQEGFAKKPMKQSGLVSFIHDQLVRKAKGQDTVTQGKIRTSDSNGAPVTQHVLLENGKVTVTARAKNLNHELLPAKFNADSLKQLSHSFDLRDYLKAKESHGNPHWAANQFMKRQLKYDALMEKHDHHPMIDRMMDSQIRAVENAIKETKANTPPNADEKALLNLVFSSGHDKKITQAIDKNNAVGMRQAKDEFTHVLNTYELEDYGSFSDKNKDQLFNRFVQLYKNGALDEVRKAAEWKQVYKNGAAERVQEEETPTAESSGKQMVLWIGNDRFEFQNVSDLRKKLNELNATQLLEVANDHKITGANKLEGNKAGLVSMIADALARDKFVAPKKEVKNPEQFMNRILDRIKETVSSDQNDRITRQLNKFQSGEVDFRTDQILFSPTGDTGKGAVGVNFTDLKTDQEHGLTIDPMGNIMERFTGHNMKRAFPKTLAEIKWDDNRQPIAEGEPDYTGWAKKDVDRARHAQKLRESLEKTKRANQPKPDLKGNDEDPDFAETKKPVRQENQVAKVGINPIEQAREKLPQHVFEKMAFAISPNPDEIKAVGMAKPKHVLLSFGTWGDEQRTNMSIKDFINQIGYKPEVIADNGAFTNYNTGHDSQLYSVMELYRDEMGYNPQQTWNEIHSLLNQDDTMHQVEQDRLGEPPTGPAWDRTVKALSKEGSDAIDAIEYMNEVYVAGVKGKHIDAREQAAAIGVDLNVIYRFYDAGRSDRTIVKDRLETPAQKEQGINLNKWPDLFKFLKWLEHNERQIDYVMAPDVLTKGEAYDERYPEKREDMMGTGYARRSMDDPEYLQQIGNWTYQVMRAGGYNTIPVFQYRMDTKYLNELIDEGANYIAIATDSDYTKKGNTPATRAEYVRNIVEKYPDVKFHLLGTNDLKLIDAIPGLYSADGKTWQRSMWNMGAEERAAAGAADIHKREEGVASRKGKKDKLDPETRAWVDENVTNVAKVPQGIDDAIAYFNDLAGKVTDPQRQQIAQSMVLDLSDMKMQKDGDRVAEIQEQTAEGQPLWPDHLDPIKVEPNEIKYRIVSWLMNNVPGLAEAAETGKANDAVGKVRQILAKEFKRIASNGVRVEYQRNMHTDWELEIKTPNPSVMKDTITITNFRDDVVNLYRDRILEGLGPEPEPLAEVNPEHVLQRGDRVRLTDKQGNSEEWIYDGRPPGTTLNLLINDKGERTTLSQATMDKAGFSMEKIAHGEKKSWRYFDELPTPENNPWLKAAYGIIEPKPVVRDYLTQEEIDKLMDPNLTEEESTQITKGTWGLKPAVPSFVKTNLAEILFKNGYYSAESYLGTYLKPDADFPTHDKALEDLRPLQEAVPATKRDVIEQPARPVGEKAVADPEKSVDTGNNKGVTGNEPSDAVRNDGGRALEGVSPENVPEPASVGETGSSPVRGAGEHQGRDGAADIGGSAVQPSLGTGEGGMDTPALGAGRTGLGEQPEHLGEPEPTDVGPTAQNFRISDDDVFAIKSQKEAYRVNVDAIRVLKTLVAENRDATPEEQKALVQYKGWGGLANVFGGGRFYREWEREYNELKSLLTPEEYRAAERTVNDSFYTSKEVIQGIYHGLQKLGFNGGRVLEPSMGVGHFFGLMPAEMANKTRLSGVELDTITGEIAKKLYPNADIRVQGFQDSKLADNFYDVAIGNVPFGSVKVIDPRYEKTGMTGEIHNYFFAKALDKIRPGGVVMLITSRYTMDSMKPFVRKYLNDRANLVGAIRLPDTAFKSNANTSVVADIIILQKRKEGEKPVAGETAWLNTKRISLGEYQPHDVNEYFVDHPEMVIGEYAKGGLYGGNSLTVKHEGNLTAAIQDRMDKLPKNIIEKWVHKATEKPADLRTILPAPGHVKENAFVIVEGKSLYVKQGDDLVPSEVTGATLDRIKGMIGIRDALRDVFQQQMFNRSDETVKAAQKRLNTVYDAFVKKHKALHDPANVRAFAEDPDSYLLLSLEKWDSTTKTAAKSDVFSKRTYNAQKEITHTDTAKEGLVVALNETGRVDLARIGQLTKKSEKAVLEELKGLVYNDPQTGAWVTVDDYLSGNVRQKLAQAEAAAEADSVFKENVEALKAVQPRDLTKEEIFAKLGAGWVPEPVMTDFLKHMLDATNLTARYVPQTGEWQLEITGKDYQQKNTKQSTANTHTWGINRQNYNGMDLIEYAMQNKFPVVYDYFRNADGSTFKRRNTKDTTAVLDKIENIKKEFRDWMWSDEARTNQLVQHYNESYRTHRLRQYDGSHLVLPGLNPHWTPRTYQLDAIWHAVQNGNTLFAHAVGAGKTFEMVATAMELRRLGLASKPMMVIRNHMIQQVGKEFMELYPAANILVPTPKDFQKANRKKLMARIATGDYDAVIIPHSQISMIPMSAEYVEQFYQEQIDELREAIEIEVERGKRSKRGIVKRLQDAMKRLETKMKTRMQKMAKDVDNVTFEELGVDSLFVDEAHNFKNLFYTTRMDRVGGLGNPDGADKSFDLYTKIRYLQQLNGGRGVVFATGTPISNSLVEMYTLQRYLQPKELERLNIHNFDAWANMFGEVINQMELSPEGKGYRNRQSFSRFVNVSELAHMFHSFADVKTAKKLLESGMLERPEAKRVTMVVPSSPELVAFVEDLEKRADAIRSGKVKPEEDNMLKITGEGRKAALDMRLVNPMTGDNPESKANMAVDYMHNNWLISKKDKSTQIVFLDLSTPKGAKSKKAKGPKEELDEDGNPIPVDEELDQAEVVIYNEMRQKLIKKGIPANEIAFIHDYKKQETKQELFNAMNEGRIRILLGSTSKMGEGMNAQKKVKWVIHLDSPWKPSEIEQREGRGLRFGNENPEVEIASFVTEKSFDAYMWGLIERKARAINGFMEGDLEARTAAGDDDVVLNAAVIKALASGNPLLQKQAELQTEVARQTHLIQKDRETAQDLKDDIQHNLPAKIEDRKKQIAKLQADIKQRNTTVEQAFSIQLGKETYTDRKLAQEKLTELHHDNFKKEKETLIGEYRGFKVSVAGQESSTMWLEGVAYHRASNELDSFDRTLRGIDNRLKEVEGELSGFEKKLADSQKLMNSANDRISKFNELLSELHDVETRLDLNSTDNQVADEGEGDQENAQPVEDMGEEGDYELAAPSRKSPKTARTSAIPATGAAQAESTIEETDRILTPKTARQVADMLARAMNTVVYRDFSVARGAEGSYNPRDKMTSVRGRSYNAWRIVGHELGHVFSGMHGRIGDRAELKAMTQLYPNPKKIPKGQETEEGFAEFFRQWVADPEIAHRNAPKTAEKFEEFIAANEELHELFGKIRTIIDADLNGTALGRTILHVISPKISKKQQLMGKQYRVPKWKQPLFQAFDHTIPARAVMKAAQKRGVAAGVDLQKLVSITGEAKARAELDFKSVPRDTEGRFLDGRPLAKIMQEAIDEIGKAIGWEKVSLDAADPEFPTFKMYQQMGTLEILSALGAAARIKERISRGYKDDTLPMTEAMADEILDLAKTKFPTVLDMDKPEGERGLYEEYAMTFSSLVLEKAERADLITPEARERVEKGSTWYMPFYYDDAEAMVPTAGTDDFGRTAHQPVRHFKARVAPILNLLDATMAKLVELEASIEKKRVIGEIRKLAQSNKLGEFVKIGEAPKEAVTLGGSRVGDQIEKILGERLTDLMGDSGLADMLEDKSMTFFIPAGLKKISKSRPVIMDVHEGKPVYIEIAPAIYQMLIAMSPIMMNGFAKSMIHMTRLTRYTALHSARYVTNAVARDIGTAIVQSKAPMQTLTKHVVTAGLAAAGLGEKADKLYEAYVQSGAFNSAAVNMLNSQVEHFFDEPLIRTQAPGWSYYTTKEGAKKALVKVLHAPTEVLKFTEELPRISEYVSVVKKEFQALGYDGEKMWDLFLTKGTDALPAGLQDEMERILVEGAHAGSQVTVDFRGHGVNEFIRAYTPTVPFLPGAMQGFYRTLRQVKEHPVKTPVVSIAVYGALAALVWGIWNIWASQDDKKWYNDLDSSVRDKYLWLPTSTRGVYTAIAKPFDYAIPMNFIERILDHTASGEKHARGIFDDMASLFSNVVGTQLVNGFLQTFLDMSYNQNALGGQIVPTSQLKDAKNMQYGPTTSLTMREVSNFFASLTSDPQKGVSPRMMDYFIKQNFGKWGSGALSVSDYAIRFGQTGSFDEAHKAFKLTAGAEYAPIVGDLLYGQAEGSSRAVTKFYNDLGKGQDLSKSAADMITKDTKAILEARKAGLPGKVSDPPSWDTAENLKLLKALPAINAINNELATARKVYADRIEKAETPEDRRKYTMQWDYFEKMGTSLIYGISPQAPHPDAQITDGQIEQWKTFFEKKAQDGMIREQKTKGGATEQVAYLNYLQNQKNSKK